MQASIAHYSDKQQAQSVAKGVTKDLEAALFRAADRSNYAVETDGWESEWKGSPKQWLRRGMELLGGGERTVPFSLFASPDQRYSDPIFVDELQVPYEWSKVRLPQFFYDLWREPIVESLLLVRYAGVWIEPLDKLPPPVSIFAALDDLFERGASLSSENTINTYFMTKRYR